MSELNELIKYIEVLEAEPFTGWTGGNKRGYITACTSIKKKAEKLAENLANGVTTGEKQCNLPVVRQQSELFVSFARFVANYKHSYATAYEDMFKEWCDKRNI